MSEEIQVAQMWKHVKRGHVYRIVHVKARCQCSIMGPHDLQETLEQAEWIAYTDGIGLYFRMRAEFLDGRFVRVS